MHAGRVIGFVRFALDHKYPNEMWVYAPAGHGHTHMVGVLAGRPELCFALWGCILRRASCLGRSRPGRWYVQGEEGSSRRGLITHHVDGRTLPVL